MTDRPTDRRTKRGVESRSTRLKREKKGKAKYCGRRGGISSLLYLLISLKLKAILSYKRELTVGRRTNHLTNKKNRLLWNVDGLSDGGEDIYNIE